MRKSMRWARLAVAAGAVLWTGCIVMPVPAKTRIESKKGVKAPEPKGLKAGETTRADAEKTLDTLLVPLDSKNLMWARYSKSNYAWIWAWGTYGGGGAGANRNWGMHNLFLTFDESGKLATLRDVNDKQLNATMREYQKSGEIATYDLSQEVVLEAYHMHAANRWGDVRIVLKPDEFGIEEYWSTKHSYHVRPEKVYELKMGVESDHPNAAIAVERFRFTDAKGKRRRMDLSMHARDVPVLLQYFERLGAAGGNPSSK